MSVGSCREETSISKQSSLLEPHHQHSSFFKRVNFHFTVKQINTKRNKKLDTSTVLWCHCLWPVTILCFDYLEKVPLGNWKNPPETVKNLNKQKLKEVVTVNAVRQNW